MRNFFRFLSIFAGLWPATNFLGQATDATWVGPTTWQDDTHWTYNAGPHHYPNAADAIARLTGQSPGTITIGTLVNLGALFVTNGNYVIPIGSDIVFTVTSGNASVNLTGGSLEISELDSLSPLVINNTSANPFTVHAMALSVPFAINSGEILFTNNVSANDTVFLGKTATISAPNPGTIVTLADLSGSGTIFLSPGGELSLNNPDSTTYSGSLIQTDPMNGGTLIKLGAETLTLLGTNSLASNGTSSLVLAQGTLAVTSEASFGNPDELVMFGDTQFKVMNGSISYSNFVLFLGPPDPILNVATGSMLNLGLLSGSGFLKDGGGTLIVSGNSNVNTGLTTVNAGQLIVTGTLPNDALINSGAFLGGTGSIGGNTEVAGTIIPGIIGAANNIGTLSLTSLVLDAGSVTSIAFTPTAFSSLAVSGSAMLAGSVSPNPSFGRKYTSGSFPFLTAGSISQAYDNLVPVPGFVFSLTQNANSVVLSYNFTGIPTNGLKGNTASFASYLNQNAPYSRPLKALLNLSGNELIDALNRSSPARNAFVPFTTQNTMFGLGEILSEHLAFQRFTLIQRHHTSSSIAAFSPKNPENQTASTGFHARNDTDCNQNCPVVTPLCEQHTFWMGGMGEYGRQKKNEQNPSFQFFSGAAMLACDFYRTEHNLFGFGAGSAYTHLVEDKNFGNSKINIYFANIYDMLYGFCDFPLYLELAAWAAYDVIHHHRLISFPGFDADASATIHSWQAVPHVGFGYQAQFDFGAIEPFAQFDLAVNWQSSFQERGAGPFDFKQDSQTAEFLRSEAGFRAYQSNCTNWGEWTILEKLSYVNKKTFHTGTVFSAISGTSTFFTLDSFRGTQNLASGGLEILFRFGQSKPVSFTLSYNAEVGSKYMSQEALFQIWKDF